MRHVFLDIDGVLNHYNWVIRGDLPFDPQCMKLLNLLVSRSQCKVVVSSAWRHLIAPDNMTVKGFENMLRTHGFKHQGVVIDRTVSDEELFGRSAQISHWLKCHPHKHYVVLDDNEIVDHPQVQPNGLTGLTMVDVKSALTLLGCSTKRLEDKP